MAVISFDPPPVTDISTAMFITRDDGPAWCNAFPMPTVKTATGKVVVDPYGIAELIRLICGWFDIKACGVEAVGARPGQGVVSMFSFGKSCGHVEGVLAAMLDVKFTTVRPQTWRRHFGFPSKSGKAPAVSYCRKTYGDATLQLPNRRSFHDGMADALCICEYTRAVVLKANQTETNAQLPNDG